jgi:hypothetical protein
MAPKEKAIQLVELYWKSEHQPFNYEHSKRCALIAVDEILLIAPEMHMEGFGNLTIREYYKKVKKEIEKL